MITESQQKTIDELKASFEQINVLELPPSNMMEEINAELNKARALKLKSETALKAEKAKAREMMASHFNSVYKPILDTFLPEIKISLRDDGGLWLGGISYHTFDIKSNIFEHKNEDKSKYYEHHSFEISGYSKNNPGRTMQLSAFDELFKNFVLDAAKSLESNYY